MEIFSLTLGIKKNLIVVYCGALDRFMGARMARAESSGYRLSPDDAGIVRGMIARGDRHHDIAAWFGVNQGRIAEVNNGTIFPDQQAAPIDALPPSGPYMSARSAHRAYTALQEARTALELATQAIDEKLGEI